MHITSQYLINVEKAVVANSKVEALKAEGSRLRKDLIATMDNNNASKEKNQSFVRGVERGETVSDTKR